MIDNIIDLGESDTDSQHPSSYTPGVKANAAHSSVQRAVQSDGQQQEEEEEGDTEELEGIYVAPKLLKPLKGGHLYVPPMSEPSALMEAHHMVGLAAEVPMRYRQSTWRLVYSTQRDGISMQTLLRNAKGKSPTVLVVRDMGRAVFGAYCSEPWRLSPRYYGTGETFVFQLAPQEVLWHWWAKRMTLQQNDFFMWGSTEALAVGGAGGYALWLDAELANGISRPSLTFGNTSLSSAEEFRIGAVELWWLG